MECRSLWCACQVERRQSSRSFQNRQGEVTMTVTQTPTDLQTLITTLIQAFCRSPQNSLQDEAGEAAWAEPLVGFSSGDDAVYQDFKRHVGAFHWTPQEIFALTFPD